MEIEVGEGLRARINSKNNTSSIIESPKANGNVFIPHYIEYKDQLSKLSLFLSIHLETIK